jgi:hypothetical protein
MEWARILAYITGTVDQELLLRNEYLVAENRILKAQLNGPPEALGRRAKLGEIGLRLCRKALGEIATAAVPTPSWHGTEGWSPASSMARRNVDRAGPGWTGRLRG